LMSASAAPAATSVTAAVIRLRTNFMGRVSVGG
jgi:hypothetical protein